MKLRASTLLGLALLLFTAFSAGSASSLPASPAAPALGLQLAAQPASPLPACDASAPAFLPAPVSRDAGTVLCGPCSGVLCMGHAVYARCGLNGERVCLPVTSCSSGEAACMCQS